MLFRSKTALNATKLLASKHKSTINSGKAIREYNSIMNKYGFDLPMTGRLSRPPDHSMSYGRDDKVWTHITVHNTTSSQNEAGKETRTVGGFIRKYFNKLEKETEKLLEKRKSMKIRIRIKLLMTKNINNKLESGEIEIQRVTEPITLITKR